MTNEKTTIESAEKIVILRRALDRVIVAEEEATAAHRAAARRLNAAFKYLNGQAPVDSRPYTPAEYRYYADAERRARFTLDRATEAVDEYMERYERLSAIIERECNADERE